MRSTRRRRGRIASYAFLVLTLALAAGCSRHTGLQVADPDEGQRLPFAQVSDKNGESPTGSLLAAEIPAGTPITIRLQSGVSSATSQAGDTFEAVLDEPIIVQGQTIVPRGAALTGKVVAAKASGRLHDPGYLKLTLTTISIHGKPLSVQCSSIFEKGGSHEKRNLAIIGGGTGGGALIGGLAGGGKGALIGGAVGAAGGTGAAYATGSKDVGFPAERRLTFRLTQPLPLPL